MFGKFQHGKYENWHNSRWKFTKKQSNYHFNTTQIDEGYQYVCNFNGYWEYELETAYKRCVPVTWATRNVIYKDKYEKREQPYSAHAEELDLFKAGANPKMELFDRAVVDDLDIFCDMGRALDVDSESMDVKFHRQRTGQMMNLHISKMIGRRERGNSFKETKFDKNPDLIKRYIIMLADWDYGQIMTFGNNTLTHWKAGDCYTWDWHNMPISTVNTGWAPRPLLQITGKAIEKDIPETIDL